MKVEHKQELLIRNLAKIGVYLDKVNMERSTAEKIQVPIDEALDEITPSWREYAHDIWNGHKANLDKWFDYSLKVSPKAGAVIISQFGDHYTIEQKDMCNDFLIVISVKSQNTIVKLKITDTGFEGHLGNYLTEWAISKRNELIFQDPLLTYTLNELKDALQKGLTFTMPPTNIKNRSKDADCFDNNSEHPF